jgi:hypothetical protein
MTTVTHLIRAAILILALSLAGCSGGGANNPAQQPTEDVTVSTPPDEIATPAPTGDFATAVKFTELAHTDKLKEAGELVVPESPADRYLAPTRCCTAGP